MNMIKISITQNGARIKIYQDIVKKFNEFFVDIPIQIVNAINKKSIIQNYSMTFMITSI